MSQNNPVSTLANGQPSENPGSVQQVRYGKSNGGLIVLSDTQTIEVLAHFARERIPERSVHAKAAGAFGEFEVLEDISDLTDADFLTGIGKKTKLLTRISTVGGEKGSSDTVRDVRGWATKFYTEEGIQDFVFNDLPVFFIRDPIKFPSMNRSHKRHPQTNVPDNTMFWDFHLNNPEGIHALMHLFGQRGIPASLRNINGFSVHTYTLNKADGSYVYAKWHFRPDDGIKTMDADTAQRLAGSEPDYHVKDLFKAIEKGDFPSWGVYIQVMQPDEVKDAPIDVFDDTYTWPFEKYPLRLVGRMTLTKNLNNYFQDLEQACFSPSNMVPGIGPSADPVLQARMFSYPDAHRYRVGPNYFQLPCNKPINKVYAPYVRDGPGTINGNYGGDPDYVGSELRPVSTSKRVQVPTHEDWSGHVTAFATSITDKDFEQPRALWKIICKEPKGKEQFLHNILPTLSDIPDKMKDQVIEYFGALSATMAPISFLDCSQEVQLHIAEILPQGDLARLSLTCRALHSLTEPVIYSSVTFEWAREFYPPITQLLQLLRTLLGRQGLCPLIRHADFEGFGYIDEMGSYRSDWTEETPEPPPVIPELPAKELSAAISKTRVSGAVAEQWRKKVQCGSPEASVAVLVSLLPNLERLCLSSNWTNDTFFLGHMLRAALCEKPEHALEADLLSLSSLKRVSLAPMIDEESHLDPSNTADALALFYLPNIETLSVSIDNPTNFTWPSSSPPKPTSLESLEIFRLRESRLAPVLSATSNLKKLKYNWMYRPDLDKEVSKDVVILDVMSEALLETKDSLEELEITAESFPAFSRGMYEPPDVTFQGSIARLREMHKLKALHIPWTFLTGRRVYSAGLGLIGAAVPPNVEHLAMDGFFMWSEDDDYEEDPDELMVDCFAKELESGALSHAQSLKSVCLPGSLYITGLSDICENKLRALQDQFRLALSYDRRRK
ncbi:catalase isozyme P [Fusarium sp. NRRL 52700]|nr:catalase isozyme P [Fusarium sp. NRRL 52700]